MRRPPQKKRSKLSVESQRLINLALAVAQSASRIEDHTWQAQLDDLVTKNLKNHHPILDAAAEHLFELHPEAYEVFIETLEALSTSHPFEYEGKMYEALLITAPVLAWTRFEMASGQIPSEQAALLVKNLHTHLLTEQAQLHLVPTLYSLDQLPRNHSETSDLLERLVMAQLNGSPSQHATDLPPVIPFLADIRFLLAAVIVPQGQPLFQWQAIESPFDCVQAKATALDQWQQQMSPVMARLLPGCNIDLLMPEAFYTACREADIKIRPALIRSAVFYLTQTLEIESSELKVIVAGFGDEDSPAQVDEYRISFILKKEPEVVYGAVWPMYQPDDQVNAIDNPTGELCIGEIPEILIECGITDIHKIDNIFAMEFCDDCHAPLFADAEAELVHAEMPDDAPPLGSEHFH